MSYKISSYDDICCFKSVSRSGLRVFWEITRECNLNCIHCQVQRDLKDELTLDQVKKIISELSVLKTVKIKFTGGEPFMYPNFIEVLNYTAKKNLGVDITSNGTLIDKKIANTLRDLKIDCVSISLNGVSPKTHNMIQRVNGAFEKTLSGINNLLDVGMNVDINTIVCRINLKELEKLIDFCYGKSVRSLNFIGLFWEGNALYNREKLELTKKQLSDCKKLIEKKRLSLSDFPIRTVRLFVEPPFQACPAGISLIGIDNKGHVQPCLNLTSEQTFDLKKNSLEKILSSESFKSFIGKIKNADICNSVECPIRSKCGKGCRGAAFGVFKNYIYPDPLCNLAGDLT